MTANTTYYYCTTANNSQGTTYNVGNNNGNSNFKTALATAPTMNNVTYSNGVNNISWSSVAGATNYTVYYCTGSSCAVTTSSPQVGTTASTSITHTPTCGTTYGYAVMANNGGGGAAPLSSPVKYISDAAGSVACYRDQDNDGYTLNIQSTICGAACPSGYKSSISSPLDCYDRNAKAYSGSTVYSDRTRGDTSAFDQSGTARTAAVGGGGSDDAGNSGTTYDYNCDGQSTLNGASPTAYVCSGGVQASGITYCSYNAGGYCDNVGTSTYYNSIGSTTTPACGSQPCSNSFTSMSQGSYTVSSCDLNPPFYTSCSGNTSGGTLINGYAAFFASCH